MYAGIQLKTKEKHTPLIQEKSADQSRAAMQASYGLEDPQLKQTDLSSALSSTRGTRAHLSKTQPKMKSVCPNARSAKVMVRPNQLSPQPT
jgi:hypothetical protein